MEKNFDVVIIGAGSGGLTSAIGLTKIGKSVLLVEREHLGGECTNTGCIPSKALLHVAKVYHTAVTVAGNNTASDMYRERAFAYVRDKITIIRSHETVAQLTKHGITVVMGEAVFINRRVIAIGNTRYHFKYAIIATGSAPRLIDVPGLSPTDVLTNQNLFTLDATPKRTIIIGGGPLGMEMGYALALLGSQVTLTDTNQNFGSVTDPTLCPLITQIFIRQNITLLPSTFISRVENKIAIFTQQSDCRPFPTTTKRVPFDKLLFAIGRVPHIPNGLDQAGVHVTTAGITVNNNYQTANRAIYALGDVSDRNKFTHQADDIARQIVVRIASNGTLAVKKKALPKVIYTEPEIAQVGLSYADAETIYDTKRIHRIVVPLSAIDRAYTDDSIDGNLIVITKRLSGRVLGAEIVGPRAGELIAIFTLAIDHKLSLWKLRRTIYAYPTYACIIKKAGDVFFMTQITSLKLDLIYLIKRLLPKIIAIIFWLTLIYFFQHYRHTHNLSYRDILLNGYDFFTLSMYGPLIYVGLYAIRTIIFFPATLMTALSGAIFGFWWGIIFTVIGENASANLAYWIGRFFGQGFKLEYTVIGNWVTKLRCNSFVSVLFMRLLYFPFDLTNYACGIVKTNWRGYTLATLIGIMPGLTTFVALGAAVNIEKFRDMKLTIHIFEPKFIFLSLTIFLFSLGVLKVLKRLPYSQLNTPQ